MPKLTFCQHSTDAKCLKNATNVIIFQVIWGVWPLVSPHPPPPAHAYGLTETDDVVKTVSYLFLLGICKDHNSGEKLIICKDSEFSCSQVSFLFIYLFIYSSGKCVENDNRLREVWFSTHFPGDGRNRPWGANRPPCTIPGIFEGYDFLKAHSNPCKIRHVSTLAVWGFNLWLPVKYVTYTIIYGILYLLS